MAVDGARAPQTQKHLGLWDAVSIILELKTDRVVVADGDTVLGVFHLEDASELL